MSGNLTRLELTWPGKENKANPEPRILIEDVTKSYSQPVSDTKDGLFEDEKAVQPTFDNLLIHGDNLLALKSLEQDYAGKVKCIYIDPPYNTGNAFEHYDDGLQHTIWLSLMRDRLEILSKLLREDGSIWISIDDNEQAYLKLLCDEIFGPSNFVANLPTIMNLKGNQDQFCFAGSHEYTIVFAKDKNKLTFNQFAVDEEEVTQEWEEDEIGLYKQGANLKSTGINAPRSKRPNLFFPVYISSNNEISLEKKEGYLELFPITDGEEMSWRWSKKKMLSEIADIIVKRNGNSVSLYKKQRPEIGDIPTKKPKSLFYKPEYSSGNGTSQIKKIFGEKVFDYPKPEELICDFITLSTNPGDLVLDSFLGSGTTAAVAHKMGRRWIGIEMGRQCYNLCIPRLQKVINGEDQGGITKSTNWKGGGGFKFYELASSLITKDKMGKEIIDPKYNADMLAEAMCKLMGYHYHPDTELYWKQGYASEKSFIFTTTNNLQPEDLKEIHDKLGEANLLICCGAFRGDFKAFPNMTLKKIPAAVLKKCEWGKPGYPLPVLEDFTDADFEFEEEE